MTFALSATPMIGSHVIYKVYTEELKRSLKARFCTHGNHDDEKVGIRKDSYKMKFDAINL